MSDGSALAISDEMALRIALAARVLPGMDYLSFLNILADTITLPPTESKLKKLTLKRFKSAYQKKFANIDSTLLRKSLHILLAKDAVLENSFLPKLDHYQDGDMPNSVRVACASNRDQLLDGHFGSCQRFLIYQVSSNEVRLIDVRQAQANGSSEDKNAYRTQLISDCQLLLVASIGGPAAAKVIKAGIHPIKYPNSEDARAKLLALKQVLNQAPPPWLAKLMGKSAEQRVRFVKQSA